MHEGPKRRAQRRAADRAMEFDVLQTRCLVLVVDDNRDIAKSLDLLLTVPGGVVRVAFDGVEAIRVFDE